MTDVSGTIRRRNPRIQGEIGLADAIAWFVAAGYRVSIPLADNQEYDLVVQQDAFSPLLRVQVETCTRRNARGRFEVMLETHGGNRSGHTRRRFDRTRVDLLFVLTDAAERYPIPAGAIHAGTGIELGDKWAGYRLA